MARSNSKNCTARFRISSAILASFLMLQIPIVLLAQGDGGGSPSFTGTTPSGSPLGSQGDTPGPTTPGLTTGPALFSSDAQFGNFLGTTNTTFGFAANVLSGQPTTPGQIGAVIGTVAGNIAGTAVAGPVGGFIGGFIGGLIGGFIGSLFGSATKGSEEDTIGLSTNPEGTIAPDTIGLSTNPEGVTGEGGGGGGK